MEYPVLLFGKVKAKQIIESSFNLSNWFHIRGLEL